LWIPVSAGTHLSLSLTHYLSGTLVKS